MHINQKGKKEKEQSLTSPKTCRILNSVIYQKEIKGNNETSKPRF